jgi:hypothetical protein
MSGDTPISAVGGHETGDFQLGGKDSGRTYAIAHTVAFQFGDNGHMRHNSSCPNPAARLLCLLLVAVALLASTATSAAVVNGITLPERIQSSGKRPELVLNGAGVRVIVLLKIYVAALYLPARNDDGDAILRAHKPSRLYMHLLRNLTMDELKSGITGVLQATLTPEQASPLDSRVRQLDSIIATRQVWQKGTIFAIDYLPNVGTTISINGVDQGRIAGSDFNEALLRIWIGDRPRDLHLRKALLGIR